MEKKIALASEPSLIWAMYCSNPVSVGISKLVMTTSAMLILSLVSKAKSLWFFQKKKEAKRYPPPFTHRLIFFPSISFWALKKVNFFVYGFCSFLLFSVILNLFCMCGFSSLAWCSCWLVASWLLLSRFVLWQILIPFFLENKRNHQKNLIFLAHSYWPWNSLDWVLFW